MSDFYITQRVRLGWDKPDVQEDLGGYRVEYMGSAEYEFGAMPQSFRALRDAKEIDATEIDVGGRRVRLIFIAAAGDPTDDFLAWIADGTPAKERPQFLDAIGERDEYNETVIWWSLGDNVIWGFTDEPHIWNIEKWIETRRKDAA